MKYFLIVYDQRSGTLRSIDEFDQRQQSEASAARARLETRHRDDPHVEIVILGSDSRETLRRTHGRYFKSVGELATEA